MVDRFFNFFQRELTGLHEAAFLLGLSALVSQLLALIRDRLLASTFGAGGELDLYYAAFRIPDLLYVSLASFVSVTVVLPFFIKHLESNNPRGATRLLTDPFSRFITLMLLAMAAAYLLMPGLAKVVGQGFSLADQQTFTQLSRILLWSPLLIGLSNLLANITQSARQFFLSALSPVLYNLGIISGLIFFYPRWGLIGLAWGVVVGALFHLLIQLPALTRFLAVGRRHCRESVVVSSRNEYSTWRQIWWLAVPRTLTLTAHQLVILVLVALASAMTAGSITVFNFSYNLQAVLLSVIGVSYSVAAFPTLVRSFANGERHRFVNQLATAARHIIFWSLPALTLFIVLRAQLVRVILGAGKFDWADTRLVAAALALFVISVTGQSLILLFVRGYYASGKTFKPLVINVSCSLLIIVLAYSFLNLVQCCSSIQAILTRALRVSDIHGTELLFLPLAFTLGVLINVVVFWWSFRRDFGPWPANLYRGLSQSLVAAAGLGFVTYWLLQLLAPFLDQTTFGGIFGQGLAAGLGGLLTGFLVLKGLGSRELEELIRSARKKFWHTKAVIPEVEEL